MQVSTTLYGWLRKAVPKGIRVSTQDNEDGIVDMRSVLSNCGRLPFPITRMATPLVPAGENSQGGIGFYRLDTMNVALGADVFAFPEGIWDVSIEHVCIPRGGVNDNTSDMSLLLQIVPAGVSIFQILNQLVNIQTISQRYSKNFTLTVSKEIPVNLRLQSAVGLGTGLNVSLLSMTANRII